MNFASLVSTATRTYVRGAQQIASAIGVAMLVTATAQAAPSVTATNGAITDGSTVTISGTGFGAGDSAPLLWENFDSTSLLNLSSLGVPLLGSWKLDTRPAPVYSTTRAHSGTRSAYAAYNSSLQWSMFTASLPTTADRIYQSFWFWWSSAGTQGQLKLVQVHGNSGTGDFAPGLMTGSSTTGWWFSYITTENQSTDLNSRSNYTKTPSAGSWHHYEMELQRSSAGGVADGSINIWIDGTKIYTKTNVVTRQNSAYNWTETSFFHGVTNMGATTDVYVDDAYLNDSWARVVIGNAATYSAVTQREIQPASSWSDTSINVRLNKGSLASFDNAYLYIIDRNGVVNSNGFKLCDGCVQVKPNPPSGVGVTD